VTNNFESRLKRIIADSKTPAEKRRARADVELLMAKRAGTLQALCDVAQSAGLRRDLRSAACWVLGQLQDHRAVPTLLTLLRFGDERVAWESAKIARGDLH